MRKLLTTILIAAFACGAGTTAARADYALLFDYVGFDYETPNLVPGFGEVGSTYVSLGTVPFLFAPLSSNTTLNEYTYVIEAVETGVTVASGHTVVTFAPGTIRLYSDAKSGGTAADYGTNPPNATAPPTFTDGEMILEGTLTNFQFVIDNTSGSGGFEAVFNVTGGTQYGNFSEAEKNGWTFSGSSSNALNIPSGYAHQIDGQTFVSTPVATRRTSWGKLKAAYR